MNYPTVFSNSSDIMFSVMPVMIVVIFVVVVGVFIFTGVRRTRQWSRNNASPVLTVDAAVVAKREDVQVHQQQMGADTSMMQTVSSTTCYATFQVPSGDRMEFAIANMEYGLLAEGDTGKLTFRGTRYLGFTRNRMI